MKSTPTEQETFVTLLAELELQANQRGLLIKDLAQRAGITPETYSRMKRRGSGDFQVLNRMARAIGYRLTLIPDNTVTEQLRKGDFFE